MKNITLILIEPENSGNTGAILRTMKNFDFSKIVLVNPKFDIHCDELRNRAKWANDLVDKLKVIKHYDLKVMQKLKKHFDYLVATTARVGRDYNILRSPITPNQLAERLNELKSGKVGILIGREGAGLNNDEITQADFSVTIPASKKYGTMNISHAVAIILYEIFKRQSEENLISHIAPISAKEKEQLLIMLDECLDSMNFQSEGKKNTQRIVWKKMIGKSFLSRREAYAIMGFLRKIK